MLGEPPAQLPEAAAPEAGLRASGAAVGGGGGATGGGAVGSAASVVAAGAMLSWGEEEGEGEGMGGVDEAWPAAGVVGGEYGAVAAGERPDDVAAGIELKVTSRVKLNLKTFEN